MIPTRRPGIRSPGRALLAALAAALALGAGSRAAWADQPLETDAGGPPPAVNPDRGRVARPRDEGRRYWHALIGPVLVGYEYSLKENLKNLDNLGGTLTHIPLSLELGYRWGFIYPNSLLGVSLQYVGDFYLGEETSVTVTQLIPSLGVVRYFGKEIGDGMFFRAEAGIAARIVSAGDPVGNFNQQSQTALGLSGGVGIGYAFKLRGGNSLGLGLYGTGLLLTNDAAAQTGSFRFDLLF